MHFLTRQDPIDNFLRGFFVRPVDVGSDPVDAPMLKIDVKEQETQYVVHAEIPGVDKDAIQVQIDGPTVSLSAERRQE